MLRTLRRQGAKVLPSNSRVRRRRTSSPPQGPPASRPVGGLRTFRDLRGSDINIQAALHPQSAQPPATSAWCPVSKEEGMRGRKVPSRGPSVLCEGRVLACSLSAVRRVRRLMRHRRGSAQSQTPPVLASSPGSVCARSSKVEFNLAAIPPGLVSLRLCGGVTPLSYTSASLPCPAASHTAGSWTQSLPGVQDTAVPAVGADSVSQSRA